MAPQKKDNPAGEGFMPLSDVRYLEEALEGVQEAVTGFYSLLDGDLKFADEAGNQFIATWAEGQWWVKIP